MIIEEFVSTYLPNVRPTSRGFLALCPAHDDRHPSLSIKEGERGILLKCWTGCSLDEICGALGIEVKELFYDTNRNPLEIRTRQAVRQYQKAKCEVEQMARGFQIDAVREGERFLKTTVGTDIAKLEDRQLDTLMNSVCDALAVQLEEERGEYVRRQSGPNS